MKKNSRISVVECKYCYNQWRFDTSSKERKIISGLKEFKHPRDVDLYHQHDIYSKGGVPYTIIEIDYENYKEYEPYVGVTRNFSDAVYESIRKGDAVLVATGYCAHAPAIVGGIQRAIGTDKKIGVIWIDAHSDNRIIETSLSKDLRFVGIPISVIAGQTFDEWRRSACGLSVPCEGKNMLVSDGRMNDEEFNRNLESAGILKLDSRGFEDEKTWRNAVKMLSDQVDAVYLSVDADILKEEYIPAYAKSVPGGHDIQTVMRNIRIVMQTGKVLAYSLFCVDFDRYEMNGEKNYISGMRLIEAGLESWSQVPLQEDSGGRIKEKTED